MSYGWQGNYGERAKARFVPAQGEPETVWPGRGFHADAGGGYGTDCVTGSRYDVLARDNPAWAAAVLSAAVAAGMPLRARKVGNAGKYRFWLLCAASPAEAEAESRRIKAAADAAQVARDVDLLRTYYPLTPDQAVVTAEGDVILAEGAQYSGRRGYCGGERRMLVDGVILPLPAGASVQEV